MSTIIPFEIDRIDPFGQGVCRTQEKVIFIPKTLPGDKGLAQIEATKGKKVQFASVKKLQRPSPERLPATCPHFQQCQGCSFLNTSYENEKRYKKSAYAFFFKKIIPPQKIAYFPAPKRTHYRNRIQLHYNSNTMGYLTRNGLLEVPYCELPQLKIAEKLAEIYSLGLSSWPRHKYPPNGHFEISLEKNDVHLYFNKNYSHGGFRQVNEEMAAMVQQRIAHLLNPLLDVEKTVLIDLFGGSGFLSDFYCGKKIVVDFDQQQTESKHYCNINLYAKCALKRFNRKLKQLRYFNNSRILILDPPRSGLKNLKDFSENTQYILYLSCNPQSQVRDIQGLLQSGKWHSEKVEFYDFFPATHHLESLVLLKRR